MTYISISPTVQVGDAKLVGFACDYRPEGWDVNVLSRGTLMHLDQMKVQEKARRLYSAALAKGNQTEDPKKCAGLD